MSQSPTLIWGSICSYLFYLQLKEHVPCRSDWETHTQHYVGFECFSLNKDDGRDPPSWWTMRKGGAERLSEHAEAGARSYVFFQLNVLVVVFHGSSAEQGYLTHIVSCQVLIVN